MDRQHSSQIHNSGRPSRQRPLDRYREYMQLAREKVLAGDRIGAENDYQHAEHFFRTAAEQKDAS